MKKLEFTTGKGRFVVVDGDCIIGTDVPKFVFESVWSIRFKDLTEEQASEIVDAEFAFEVDDETSETKRWEKSALDSLHSLIKSKGWYLSNPHKKPEHYDLWAKYGDFTQYGKSLTESVQQWQQAESRTLNNPVIFKIK